MERLLQAVAASWPLKLTAYLLAWSVPALISTTQLLLSYSLRGDAAPIRLLVQVTFPTWLVWAALAPLIYLAARRFPLDGGRWTRSLPVHLALCVCLLLASVALVFAARGLLGVPFASYTAALVSGINTSLLAYWAIVSIAHATRYWQEGRARAVREAELSAQLSRARLEALRSQLHPHFLFNTLHAISAFVRREPDKAESMLAELGDLLRITLEEGDEPTTTLDEEIAFIERYLSIQKTRLGERLTVSIDVPAELGTVEVPRMLLQPIVENAVEHGVVGRRGPGAVRVSAVRHAERILIEVSDDGPGLEHAAQDPEGWSVGLRNTRERLARLYGPDHELRVENAEAGGVRVTVGVPTGELGGRGERAS
jgi:two-component system, LytTR family, sensor kinase